MSISAQKRVECMKFLIFEIERELNEVVTKSSKASFGLQNGVASGSFSIPEVGSRFRVIENYERRFFDELSLTKGRIVIFLEQLEHGWWKGQCNGVVSSKDLCRTFTERYDTKSFC